MACNIPCLLNWTTASISKASAHGAPSYTTGICIYCNKFITMAMNPPKKPGVYDKRANQSQGLQYVEGDWCELGSYKYCVKAADPIDFHTSLDWKKSTTDPNKWVSPKYVKPTVTPLPDKFDPVWLADQLNNYITYYV